MITCQVDAGFSGMGQEEVGRELLLLGEVLAALDGELLGADVDAGGSLVAYVRAESEMLVYEIFEASRFVADRIAYLGPSFDAVSDARAGRQRPQAAGIAHAPLSPPQAGQRWHAPAW